MCAPWERQISRTGQNRNRQVDHEYVRHGVATLLVEVEALAGRRHVEVTERRTRQDWARFIKTMFDERYPDAIRVRLAMDNLNTHDLASLYDTFPPVEARRLAERLEIHCPKHGSWLSIAEIGLSVLNGQCLGRCISAIATMRREISAWQQHCDTRDAPIHWRFATKNAHQAPQTIYPKL